MKRFVLMRHSAKFFSALMALAVAACGGPKESAEPSPGNFVPPVTQAPTPLPGQRQSTSLASYVGHYPHDAVDGVGFYDRSEVANLLVDLVPDEKLRRMIAGREATTVPIVQAGSRIAAHGCEAHDCADRNWTLEVALNGNLDEGSVCYHDAEAMGQTSRWTTRAGTERRPGDCPQG